MRFHLNAVDFSVVALNCKWPAEGVAGSAEGRARCCRVGFMSLAAVHVTAPRWGGLNFAGLTNIMDFHQKYHRTLVILL
jgi:hypothetical protein